MSLVCQYQKFIYLHKSLCLKILLLGSIKQEVSSVIREQAWALIMPFTVFFSWFIIIDIQAANSGKCGIVSCRDANLGHLKTGTINQWIKSRTCISSNTLRLKDTRHNDLTLRYPAFFYQQLLCIFQGHKVRKDTWIMFVINNIWYFQKSRKSVSKYPSQTLWPWNSLRLK